MVTIEEMVSVVKAYIHHRTEKEIEINMQQFAVNGMAVMMLHQAYQTAVNWFNNNKGKIEIIKT